MDNLQQKIFISYSSKDYDEAAEVLQFLENSGIRCWMAPRNIHAGEDYAQTSVWVPKELDLGLSFGKKVILFTSMAAPLQRSLISGLQMCNVLRQTQTKSRL